MPPFIQSWRSRLRPGRPVWFAGLYVASSCAWIFLTDKLLEHLALTQEETIVWSTVKGFLYVAITGWVIYAILRRLRDINQNLESAVASRTAALAASEEESRAREDWLHRLLASLPDVAWTSAKDGRHHLHQPQCQRRFRVLRGRDVRKRRRVVVGANLFQGPAARYRGFSGALLARPAVRRGIPDPVQRRPAGSGCTTAQSASTAKMV